ncbi:hypothetical protein GXP67_19730 [Rhodocytophaga rosea]|uniref:Uncharacterized protein n=1 Tax=Rhodocytophaga rosea TaxID=2704465 RepID=A0A6C0GL27_9BACT|nr:hypothetical protein [Rhodocytophaga rosea]QHT68715.1 hypothetical protein GXP67_19730 [Rhodocytophaga rosea]
MEKYTKIEEIEENYETDELVDGQNDFLKRFLPKLTNDALVDLAMRIINTDPQNYLTVNFGGEEMSLPGYIWLPAIYKAIQSYKNRRRKTIISELQKEL